MLQKKRKVIGFCGSMLLSALVFLIIYKLIPIVYSTNDDRMIAEIISGQFTGKPESYGIQMSYGFTWFLSKLYELARGWNWYGIVLIGAQLFSFGTILYRLQSFVDQWQKKALLLAAALGMYLTFWMQVYVQLTYTTTAAFVGLAAIFWYASSKTDWKNLLMTGVLANLAFSIRPNIFYMLLPATGLVYLWKLIGKKERSRLTITGPFLILTVTLGLFLVNAAAYSKDGWKEFYDFFDIRTQVYDYYDLLPYEEYPQLYEPYGISQEEYQLLRVYDYTVLGELPKEFFPQYVAACKAFEKEQGITFFTKSLDAGKIFIQDVASNAYGMNNTILFVGAAVLLILLLRKKEYVLAGYLAVQSAAVCVLWLYFTYWGRAIERIQMTMSLIFLAVLLHVLFEMRQRQLWKWHPVTKGVTAAAMLLLCFFAVKNFRFYRYDNIAKTNWYGDVQTIQEYCAATPDRLYYMDIATMTELYGKCTLRNQGPEYINYISLGDWSAYCPHYEEKLKRYGVESIAETITDENTYVIMLYNYQLKCLKEYFNVTEEWTETIFGAGETAYAVYQFYQ